MDPSPIKWNAREEAVLRKWAPDLKSAQRHLPHRKLPSLKAKAIRLGLLNRPNFWTKAEDEALRNGIRDIPGRTRLAVQHRVERIGATTRKKARPFTQDEIAKIQQGVFDLEGRAGHVVAKKRLKLGILLIEKSPLWTPAEVAQLKMNPRAELPGRSSKSLERKRLKLGIYLSAMPATIMTPSDLLREVQRAVPRHLPPYLRDDVISELTMQILEGEISHTEIAAAVRKATAAVYRQYPVLGAPISLDAPMFDDGGGAMIDRISSEQGMWTR